LAEVSRAWWKGPNMVRERLDEKVVCIQLLALGVSGDVGGEETFSRRIRELKNLAEATLLMIKDEVK